MPSKVGIEPHVQEVTRLYKSGASTDTIKTLLKGRGVSISSRTLLLRLEELGLRRRRTNVYNNEALQKRVKELYDQHLSPRKVKEILASEGRPLSDRTLLAFRKRLGIKLRTDDPIVRKQQEDEIRELLTKEYEKGTIQGLGRKLLQNFLQERGIFYPRERLFAVYGELKPGGQGPIGFHPKESGRAGASAGGHNAKAALKRIRGEKKAARDAARAAAATSSLTPSSSSPPVAPQTSNSRKRNSRIKNSATDLPDGNDGQTFTTTEPEATQLSSTFNGFDFNNNPLLMPQASNQSFGLGLSHQSQIGPQGVGSYNLAARRAWLEAELQRVELEEAQLRAAEGNQIDLTRC